jgi:hypothetical protein
MTNKVWVVYRTDIGWDCIIAAYDYNKVSEDTLLRKYPKSDYYLILDQPIEDTVDFDD